MPRLLPYLFALLALFAASGCHARPSVGELPPDDLGRDRHGEEVRLSALHGKVVLVSFWASWCGYCMKEMPVLAALQKMKGADQLAVIGVSHQDDLDTFRKIRNRWQSLSVVLTYDAGDDRIARPWGVDEIPYLVMIGRDGRIAHIHVGYGEEMLDSILAEVDDLLEQPAPSPRTASASR